MLSFGSGVVGVGVIEFEIIIYRFLIGCLHVATNAVAADALTALGPLADITGLAWGGYPSAERTRILLGREELLLDTDLSTSETVAAVQVRLRVVNTVHT